MNESDQAQAIAEIQRYEHVDIGGPFTSYMSLEKSADGEWVEYEAHKAIVDSQAQKIAQIGKNFNLAATIAQEHKDKLDAITEEYADYKHKSGAAVVDLIDKNNEQAKELAEARAIAEKMRDRSERPGGGHTFLPWDKK